MKNIKLPKYLKWKLAVASLFGLLALYGFRIVFEYAEKADYISDFVDEYVLYTFFPEWFFWIYFSFITMMIFFNTSSIVTWIIEDRNIRKLRIKKVILRKMSRSIAALILYMLTITIIVFYSYSLLPESSYGILDCIFNILGVLGIIFAIYLIVLTTYQSYCSVSDIKVSDKYSIREMIYHICTKWKKRKKQL